MIEVLISVVLIAAGVLSLLSLLPSGWRLSGTSDNLGRAAGILQAALERNEIMIMNGDNSITPNSRIERFDKNGKETAKQEDIFYTVATATESSGGGFRVRVTVTWTGNPTGIAESLIVGRQMAFSQ